MKQTTQTEQVIHAMEKNGGFAALRNLYDNVNVSSWKTKTPFATIRRIVQDERYFFKIKTGLWALNFYKNKLPKDIRELINETRPEKDSERVYTHAYYQGLLVEIGNLSRKLTYVPSQDRNKSFMNKKLVEYASIKDIPRFGYERFVSGAKSIDVIWFNEREMPYQLFEIEHTTNIEHSLVKFVELQDFNCYFYIVADEIRRREYGAHIQKSVFQPILKKLNFMNYEEIDKLYNSEIKTVETKSRLFHL